MHFSDSIDVLLLGKLINPIVVSCLDKSEFHDWIRYYKNADVPILSPPPPVYDIIYTPTQKQVSKTVLKVLWCRMLEVTDNAVRYSLSPLLFSGSWVWQVERQQQRSHWPAATASRKAKIPWAPAARWWWQPHFPWLHGTSLCKCLSQQSKPINLKQGTWYFSAATCFYKETHFLWVF